MPYTEGMLQADEFREWAKQRLLGCNVDAELLSFEAHAMANDRRLRDWQAGFRQWLLKARADARPPTRGASTPSAAPPTREQAEWFVRQWIKGAHGQEVAATWVGPGYAPSDERAWPIVSDAYSRLKADWTEGRRW